MATANSIGAIPAVITFSHHINLDKIVSTDTFLEKWYFQILGDATNLGPGNTIKSPPTTTPGSNDLTNLENGKPQTLNELATSQTDNILPYITSSEPTQDYTNAYNQASATVGKALSGKTNKDLASDQSTFPVLWLQDIQNGQLAFSSRDPSGNLVNRNSGAPSPTAVDYNYILGEIFIGLNNTGEDNNNGDVTYIEQMGLPLSLNLWYTDASGNLYRGVQDQNGAGLSIPGTDSYVINNTYNVNVNNAGSLAQELYTKNSELKQHDLKTSDGSLYFNPKDLFIGSPSSVVDPKYGDFYDYFQYLSTLSSTEYPIRWSGEYNQEKAYRITDVTFNGFSNTGEFRDYDQNSSIHLSLSWGDYTTSSDGSTTPPNSSGLTQTADIIIPWLGVPGQPQGIAPANNQYTIVNSNSNPNQPSGGWSLTWSPSDQAYSGALVTLKALQDSEGKTSDVTTNGAYQAAGLFSYYSKLFTYNSSTLSLASNPYTWQASEDPLLSFTPPSSPQEFDWHTITQNGQAGDVAGLQIRYQNGQWQFRGTNPNFWTGIGAGTEFSVPGGGLLPGQFNPTVTLITGPDQQTSLKDITFKPNPDAASDIPITGFEVLAQDGKTVIATLTLNDTYQANQLVNPTGFTYAANAAGILGANAGYYYRDNPTTDYTPVSTLQNDLYGTVVGDFLSLVNAGLLGASQTFTYPDPSGTPTTKPIGQLAKLDPSYSVTEGAITPSPWLDKLNGPVANGLFGSNAWPTLPAGVEAPYNSWASLINEYAPSVYGFGLSDRFKNGYDINLNLERTDLSALTNDQREKFQLLKFNPSAQSASTAFSFTNAANVPGDYLYPLFIEYQIGGFGQPGDPGYNVKADFLPDYNTTRAIVTVPTPQGDKQIRVEFRQGQLVAGSDLQLLNSLELDPATLQALAGLGVVSNGTGIAFQLDSLTGAVASLNSDLDLVAADLLPKLSDSSGRLPNRRLLQYSLDASGGGVTPLSFDPVTGAGAQFFDLNDDGAADFISLGLIDGGAGDLDGVANGRIDAASFSSYADLPNLGFSRQGSELLTISDPTNAAPVGLNLRAQLLSRPDSSNQIGYVVLTPEELANPERSLQDPDWLRSRARILFSTLEAQDLTLPSDADFQRNIRLLNGQSLRFFEVVDASLDQLDSLSDDRFRYLSLDTVSEREATVVSSTGTGFALSLQEREPGLNALISQAQDQAAVLDLTPLQATQVVEGSLSLAREADLTAVAGFYRTLDRQGAVLGSDGLTILRPGDTGYAEAALRSDNVVAALGDLSVADNETSRRDVSFGGPGVLAPFAQVNGETFFAYAAANTDGLVHFRGLGNNTFGLEDLRGGGDNDFDDLIVSLDFKAIV